VTEPRRAVRVAVYGLWHLGCVTAGCLAAAGHRVVGIDPDDAVVRALREAQPPLHEPGLEALLASGLQSGRLAFTTRPAEALAGVDVLWVTFDTPVDDRDEADVTAVRARLEEVADAVAPGTLVLISSQVPVGFTAGLAREWRGRGLRFAYSPENLRLGQAIRSFQHPDRVVVGLGDAADRPLLLDLLGPMTGHIEWMSVESAEMTKHALNAFLATSVTFINEIARLCEATGADAREVEQGLRTDARIGSRAYLAPGGPFAGGTLARDVRFLQALADRHRTGAPLLDGVVESNARHRGWLRATMQRLLGAPAAASRVAVLGLTYKPGTSTLRRSESVETCAWLRELGAEVRAHDPTLTDLPADLRDVLRLCPTPQEALAGADLALVATAWPEYRALRADDFATLMRRPRVVDQGWFLADALAHDGRIAYAAPGRRPRE